MCLFIFAYMILMMIMYQTGSQSFQIFINYIKLFLLIILHGESTEDGMKRKPSMKSSL